MSVNAYYQHLTLGALLSQHECFSRVQINVLLFLRQRFLHPCFEREGAQHLGNFA